MAQRSPYPGTIRARNDATNADLVRDVVEAATYAADRLQWPNTIATRDAARVMHAFAANHIRYQAEDGDQLIRMPWRTVADGVGDCKSTAVLIAAMCAAAGRRVVVRFVEYEGQDWYGHVYAVVDGVPVDPQLDFGDEVLYCARLDHSI